MDKDKFSSCLLIIVIILVLLAAPRKGGTFYRSETRDTTIYKVTYRDSVVYRFEHKDSVITDYTAVPLTDFDTITLHDTVLVLVPISSYHFSDTMADIWARGYRVSIDSVRYHFREVTKIVEREVTVRPKIFTVDAGLTMYMGESLDLDMSAGVRLGDRWSLHGVVGLTTRDGLSPFAGVSVRCRIR